MSSSPPFMKDLRQLDSSETPSRRDARPLASKPRDPPDPATSSSETRPESGSRLYLVCYDISDNRRRSRFARRLLDFGNRVQESVFECRLRDADHKRLMEAIGRIAWDTGESVRVYQFCGKCRPETRRLLSGSFESSVLVY